MVNIYLLVYIMQTLLVETFGKPLSTLQRWGDALLTGDILIINKAFSGQGAEVRITPEIKRYVINKFNEIYEIEKYRYSSIILDGIKDIFKEEFTSEAIRPIINNQKNKLKNKYLECKNDEPSENSTTRKNDEPSENSTTRKDDNNLITTEKLKKEAKGCDSNVNLSIKNQNNRKLSLSNQNNGEIRIHHLGVVLALHLINELRFDEKIVYQWLASILAGAVNIEQTASLDFKSLERLLCTKCITSQKQQHTILTKTATEENANEIFKQNASLLDLNNCKYFYFDPHSISYTGIRKIVKGWCGSAGEICKVYYQDFFHDDNGNPVYFKIFDNYFDMRERFKDTLIDDFRDIILNDINAKPTFIIDRGIYGKDKMEAIAEKKVGLVTWEKGYLKDGWDTSSEISHFIIQRPKNNSKDVKTWKVKFIKDENWNKINGFHRLIVKIQPPKKGNIEQPECDVSILSNGFISDLDAVEAMLTRWVQENDFKYMIEHFGLNEITSYKYYNYSEIKKLLKEKEFNEDIQKLLIEKEIFSDEYKQHSKLLTSLNSQAKILSLKKEKSKGNKKKFNSKDEEQLKKILESITEAEKNKKESSIKVSKLATFINKDFKFLNYEKKRYMDVIKILARNIFYKVFRIFRPIYDNFREDHKLVRELIQATGSIKFQNKIFICSIDTARNYNKKQKKAIEKFLILLTDSFNLSNKNIDGAIFKFTIL